MLGHVGMGWGPVNACEDGVGMCQGTWGWDGDCLDMWGWGGDGVLCLQDFHGRIKPANNAAYEVSTMKKHMKKKNTVISHSFIFSRLFPLVKWQMYFFVCTYEL